LEFITRSSRLRVIVHAQAMGNAITIQRATASEIALYNPDSTDILVVDHIGLYSPRAAANPIAVAATRTIASSRVKDRRGRVIVPCMSSKGFTAALAA
jgi:hypothetical protein